MENDQEIAKLTRILRGIARADPFAGWREPQADVAPFSIDQYNRVLTRLKELEPAVAPIFEPLPAGSSLTVVAMACRQLAAYFDDEAPRERGAWGGGDWKGVWADPRAGIWVDRRAFKEFWA